MADAKRRSCRVQKSTKSRPVDDEQPQDCIVCLDKITCRGKLSVCQHWFCFSCILEWSKNTNTCPVCKLKFRCISKIHLVQGKSPIQKVRVPDVDQRTHIDEDELWAERSSLSESDMSNNYEPESDPEDRTFQYYHSPALLDSEESELGNSFEAYEDNSEFENGSCYEEVSDLEFSDLFESDREWLPEAKESVNQLDLTRCDEEISLSKLPDICQSESECSESISNCSSPIMKKSKRCKLISLSDNDDFDNDKIDSEWESKYYDRKSQKTNARESGFHTRRKSQRLSNQEFEAKLERRRHHTQIADNYPQDKRNDTRKSKAKNKSHEKRFATRSNIGQWLNTGSCSQAKSSSRHYKTLTRRHQARTTTGSIDVHVQMTVTYESKTRSQSGTTQSSSQEFRSPQSSHNHQSRPSRLRQSRSQVETSLSQSSSEQSSSRRPRSPVQSSFKQSGVWHSSLKHEASLSGCNILPKKRSHKKLTFHNESDSEDSGDSWKPLVRPKRKLEISTPKLSVPESGSKAANSAQHHIARRTQRNTRNSQVLQEMQNIVDKMESS